MGFIQYIPRRGLITTGRVTLAHYDKFKVVHVRISGGIARSFTEVGGANIFIGAADKSGLVRIEASASGTQKCSGRIGAAVVISLHASALGLNDRYFGATDVPFTVDDDGIIIDLRGLLDQREMLAAAE